MLRNALLSLTFMALTVLGADAAQAQVAQCSNLIGQIFSINSANNFPGALIIAPVNFQGQSVLVAPIAHPTVAYANVDWAGNGMLLMRNGDLAAVWYGRTTLVARCSSAQMVAAPPPVPPAVPVGVPTPPPPSQLPEFDPVPYPPLVPPPPAKSDAPQMPIAGQQVIVKDPFGRETSFPLPDGALPMLASEQAAVACSNNSRGDGHAFLKCLVDNMTDPTQRSLLHCVQDNGNAVDGGACIARVVDPRAGQAINALRECGATKGETDWNCLARSSLDGRTLSAYKCVADEDTNVADCLDALGADEQTKRAAKIIQSCYDAGSDVSDYALCALEKGGNRDVARAASCVKQQMQSGDASYVGAGLCFAAGSLNLNPEQRIAVECAVSTGGQPYAFAACAGGRLTVRELTKCFTKGVGGDGCFGPNNEIVKALRTAGIDVNNLANPNGEVIKAWNTVSNDLRNGPGPNNDAVRVLNQVQNTVTTGLNNVNHDLHHGLGQNNEIAKFSKNAVNDLSHGPGPNNEVRKAVCGLFHC